MIEKILKRSLLIVSIVLGVMSLLTGIAGGFTPEIVNAIQNTPPVITAGWTVVNYELGVSAPLFLTHLLL